MKHLADEEQQVGVTGEVHGEEEEGQLLHHGDAALVGQREGQGLHFWSFFGRGGLCVQSGAGPLRCPPQTDQVFKVLRDGGQTRDYETSRSHTVFIEELLKLKVCALLIHVRKPQQPSNYKFKKKY